MNDRHVGGYISLTTHELNISESKYSAKGVRLLGFDNDNAQGSRGRPARSSGVRGGRGRSVAACGEVERFRRDVPSRQSSSAWNDDESEECTEREHSGKNKIEFRPKSSAPTERSTFRLRKI